MSTALAEGTTFADRYRIVRRIAMGGMGAVYEAVHLETGRRRALKVMHAHMFQSEELRERFKQEARIAAAIESEHIVDVSDAGVDEATEMPFMVMELLRGEELSRRLKRGSFSPADAVSSLHQMAMALDRTHAASIVHRDLKPENIFLCERDDGSTLVKILDFGVAKLLADGSATAGATQSMGTPLYMAPEQFRSAMKLTAAADTYALGLLAYTMLVGQPYWQKEARSAGESIAFAFVAAHGPQQPAVARAAELGVALPPAFDPWFTRVTNLDPALRILPASELVRTLAEVLEVPLPAKAGPQLSSPGVAVAMTSLGAAPPSARAEGFTMGTGTGAPLHSVAPSPRRGAIAVVATVTVVAALGVGAWVGHTTTGASPAPAAPVTLASTSTPPGAIFEPVPTVAPAEGAPVPTGGTPAPPVTSAPPASPSVKAPIPPLHAAATAPAPRPATTRKTSSQLLGRD